MTDERLLDAKVQRIVNDAIARLDPAGQARVAAYLEAHPDTVVVINLGVHTTELVLAGELVAAVDTGFLLDDRIGVDDLPLERTEVIPAVPDFPPDDWNQPPETTHSKET